MNTIRVGIVGGAGYTGGEALRLLLHHPNAHVAFVHSNSQAGKPVCHVHTDLVGDTDMVFTGTVPEDKADLLILCVPHGQAAAFLGTHPVPGDVGIIDLSQDHRVGPAQITPDGTRQFVYGLPEQNRALIQGVRSVANPGCFATAIQLAVLPLARGGLLGHDLHVTATTGSTGAGVTPAPTVHFSWRNNNISSYKEFGHQHLQEICQGIKECQPFEGAVHFIPYRGNFTRGILASVYTRCPLDQSQAVELYQNYYAEHPFVFVSTQPADLKQVVNTNKCLLHVQKHGDLLLVTSVIDNLLKGASGQAVQNMNLMYGLDETTGLKLKASAY